MSRTFDSCTRNIKDAPNSASSEHVASGVIPSARTEASRRGEARNLSLFKPQEKRDSSARSVPRFTENVLRERNDNFLSFLGEGGRDMEE
jgi:hypothetical protein